MVLHVRICPKRELRAILLAIWAVERMSKLRRNLGPHGDLTEQCEIAANCAFRSHKSGQPLSLSIAALFYLGLVGLNLASRPVTRAARVCAHARVRSGLAHACGRAGTVRDLVT